MGLNIERPDLISPGDFEVARILSKALAGDGNFIKDCSARFVKSGDNSAAAEIAEAFSLSEVSVRLPLQLSDLELFGTEVVLGPVIVELSRARLRDQRVTLDAWATAAVGESVLFTFERGDGSAFIHFV